MIGPPNTSILWQLATALEDTAVSLRSAARTLQRVLPLAGTSVELSALLPAKKTGGGGRRKGDHLKLSTESIHLARKLFKTGRYNHLQLARRFKVSRYTMTKALNATDSYAGT